tara:strand:- start:332 stop:1168 length:837 start_codon:yes stop_codon:yes gene_type:complete
MSAFPADTTMLYMGSTVFENNLPWHYIPVWILVTTPPLIILLFFSGIIFLVLKIYKNKISNYEEKEIILIANLLLVVCSIFVVIFLQSTLYNGWRHMYFVYPSMIIISVEAFFRIFDKFKDFRFKTLIFTFVFITFIFHQVNLIVKSHPMQNVYFNFIVGKNWKNKFDLDYWGLGNHLVIRDILLRDTNEKITVCEKSYMALKTTLRILDQSEKNRIKLQCSYNNSHVQKVNNEPDYLIDNYFRPFEIKNINLNKYKIFNELKVFDEIIITVYKKKSS